MRKIFILMTFISLHSFAQHTTFHMKDGSEIVADDSYFNVSVKGKTIEYKHPGSKKWEKVVRVDELDYATVGDAKFKSFGDRGYFVLAEQNGRFLTSKVLVQSMGTDTFYQYTIAVLEENPKKPGSYKTVDDIVFTRWKSKGKAEDRSKVPAFIKKYFPDCKSVNDRFELRDSDAAEMNLRMCDLCDRPVYLNCN